MKSLFLAIIPILALLSGCSGYAYVWEDLPDAGSDARGWPPDPLVGLPGDAQASVDVVNDAQAQDAGKHDSGKPDASAPVDASATDAGCYVPSFPMYECGAQGRPASATCATATEFCLDVISTPTESFRCHALPDQCTCTTGPAAMCPCLLQNYKCPAGLRVYCTYNSNSFPIVQCG